MVTIKNPTRSPFTVVSLNGPVHVPAFGEGHGDFDPSYLNVIRASGVLKIVEEDQSSSLSDEYERIAGKEPDKRWSEKRIAEELAKLKG